MLWRSVRIRTGMCNCIGSMNFCRNFRREVLDKRSHAMFEPFGAGFGDWCVRVRVIGEGFASLSRVSSHAPKTIWASHRGRGWGTLRDWPGNACIRGADGVFKIKRDRGGRGQFVILFGAVCYTFVSARISDVSGILIHHFCIRKKYVVSAMYQRCISDVSATSS